MRYYLSDSRPGEVSCVRYYLSDSRPVEVSCVRYLSDSRPVK